MYLRAAKADAEEAGIETDGMANSVSELRETIKTLTHDKVDIMSDEAGTKFKSTTQIMREIAEVYDSLSDVDQAALLKTISGRSILPGCTAMCNNNIFNCRYPLKPHTTISAKAVYDGAKAETTCGLHTVKSLSAVTMGDHAAKLLSVS